MAGWNVRLRSIGCLIAIYFFLEVKSVDSFFAEQFLVSLWVSFNLLMLLDCWDSNFDILLILKSSSLECLLLVFQSWQKQDASGSSGTKKKI